MAIMIKDLMNLKSLSNMKLVAGNNGITKNVEWIYVAECFDDPLEGVKWLQGGEIVFITGNNMKGDLSILKELIKGISKKQGAGLIVNIGPYIKFIPDEIIKISNELSIPLFTLPWETKLVEISQEISNAIIISRIEENSMTHLLNNILFSEEEIENSAIEKAAYFGYNLFGKCYISIINMDNLDEFLKLRNIESESKISEIRKMFKEIVEDILNKYALEVPIIDKYKSIIVFNRADDDCSLRYEKAFNEIIEVLNKRMRGLSITIGVGNTYDSIKYMKKSLKEAELAIKTARCTKSNNAVMRYKDIGIYGILFSVENKDILNNFYKDVLGPIIENDRKDRKNSFIQVLETYLDENCNVTTTAEKLFLHRNTLKYRIKRIEELLNIDLRDFNDCIKLKIALYIKNMVK